MIHWGLEHAEHKCATPCLLQSLATCRTIDYSTINSLTHKGRIARHEDLSFSSPQTLVLCRYGKLHYIISA